MAVFLMHRPVRRNYAAKAVHGSRGEQEKTCLLCPIVNSERRRPMRLDKYLKVSRLIKRRTVANEACDAGRVTINDRPAKASAEVKAGDIIAIRFGDKEVRVEVLAVQETVRKDDAAGLFKYI